MLEVWYAHLDMGELMPRFQSLVDPKRHRACRRAIAKAHTHDSLRLTTSSVTSLRWRTRIRQQSSAHRTRSRVPRRRRPGRQPSKRSTTDPRLHERSRRPPRTCSTSIVFVHLARKVVGVGSVGTEAWIASCSSTATPAPLSSYRSRKPSPPCSSRSRAQARSPTTGDRVVVGQRLMQSASDIFLGWERVDVFGAHARLLPPPAPRLEGLRRYRRDDSGKACDLWGRMCAWTLARAHARSGRSHRDHVLPGNVRHLSTEPSETSAVAYADQNERDHRALGEAVTSGRLAAESGV